MYCMKSVQGKTDATARVYKPLILFKDYFPYSDGSFREVGKASFVDGYAITTQNLRAAQMYRETALIISYLAILGTRVNRHYSPSL